MHASRCGFYIVLLAACTTLGVGCPQPVRAQWAIDFSDAIARPRFAAGDVDGDGLAETVVGGRVGPFRPEGTPVSSRRSRVEVCRLSGDMLIPLASNSDVCGIEDVAVGDLDGDGRAEVLAVGHGRLLVLSYSPGALVLRRREHLPCTWTDRVDAADLDADGRAEVVVTLYGLEPGHDVGETRVSVLRWQAGALHEIYSVDVPAHVGDLALADLDGHPGQELVLEVGTGEEGGQARVYRASGRACVEVWRGPLTRDRLRALDVTALSGSPGWVAAAAVDGVVRVYLYAMDALRLARQEVHGTPRSGLVIVHDPVYGAKLRIGGASPGSSPRTLKLSP